MAAFFSSFAGFPDSAPVPPLALLFRQSGVLRLGDRRREDVHHAWVTAYPRQSAQTIIELPRVLPDQLLHPGDPEELKIADRCRPHRVKVPEVTGFFFLHGLAPEGSRLFLPLLGVISGGNRPTSPRGS